MGDFRRITNDLNRYDTLSATRDGRSLVTVVLARHNEHGVSNVWGQALPGISPISNQI